MVVVIIVGIIAAMAIPTMVQARLDRNAYDDAGAVMQLLRNARTRAVARGGAVVITMTSSSTDHGTFQSWEAVSANATANNWAGVQANQTPVGTCKAPTKWLPLDATNTSVQLIDGVNLNGNIETDANIWATLNTYPTATPKSVNTAWICFTPLGHVYLTTTSNPTYGTVNPFDGVLPMVGPVEVLIGRYVAGASPSGGGGAFGTLRSVFLPPNGMARIFSHVAP
jgi:type II secretory pathway pseudopilin PulG